MAENRLMYLPDEWFPEWKEKNATDFELSGIHVWKVNLLDWKGWENKYLSWLS